MAVNSTIFMKIISLTAQPQEIMKGDITFFTLYVKSSGWITTVKGLTSVKEEVKKKHLQE